MTRSLYTKFLLGYLVFGLLGFIFIATMSSEITYQYLLEEKSESLYDEANLLASTYSDIYQGKNISLSTANPQLQAVATYLKAQAWVINQKGSVVAETVPASHIGTAIDGFDPTVAGNRSYMTGSFFGMFDKEMLSVIAPITGNFNTYGYVVIHMPIEQIVHGKDRIPVSYTHLDVYKRQGIRGGKFTLIVWLKFPAAYSFAPAVIFFNGTYTVFVNTRRMIRERMKTTSAVMYTMFRIRSFPCSIRRCCPSLRRSRATSIRMVT